MPILVQGNLTMSPESQNQTPLATSGGDKQKRMEAPLFSSVFEMFPEITPTFLSPLPGHLLLIFQITS